MPDRDPAAPELGSRRPNSGRLTWPIPTKFFTSLLKKVAVMKLDGAKYHSRATSILSETSGSRPGSPDAPVGTPPIAVGRFGGLATSDTNRLPKSGRAIVRL